jgi:hypothetical protein
LFREEKTKKTPLTASQNPPPIIGVVKTEPTDPHIFAILPPLPILPGASFPRVREPLPRVLPRGPVRPRQHPWHLCQHRQHMRHVRGGRCRHTGKSLMSGGASKAHARRPDASAAHGVHQRPAVLGRVCDPSPAARLRSRATSGLVCAPGLTWGPAAGGQKGPLRLAPRKRC